ncbi:MAG: LCP family protein [Acidimicrobiia bacterium]
MSTALRRTVKVAVAIPLVLALAFTLSFAAWLHGWKVPFASGSTWFSVTATGEAHYDDDPTQPVFMLVIGSDLRPGVAGGRADAVHVIGVNPALHKATIIDIPRDTEVAIPGHGRNKVNAANSLGGPRLMAEAVGGLLGMKIPYAIVTDFEGFRGLVDEIGGLDINIPTAMHDSYSGAAFDAGPAHLSGTQVLAFSRDRHSFPNSDITRTQNQGLVILAGLAQYRAKHTGVSGTLQALATLGRHTQLDGIGLRDLYRLARVGLAVDPANVRNVLMPWGPGRGGNLNPGPGAAALFADFRDDGVLETH